MAGLVGGTPAGGFSQIAGEDGAFEPTGAFACLLNEALPAAKQPNIRAQWFAGQPPDAGVENDSAACASLPLVFLTLIPPSGPPPQLGLSLLEIAPAPVAVPMAAGATGPRETLASGSESPSTPQPAELIPLAATALASAPETLIEAGKPESPATTVVGRSTSQSPAETTSPLAFSWLASEPEMRARQAVEAIEARPAPSPEAPVLEAPAPQAPAPEAPTLEASVPEAPAPEAPVLEAPVPRGSAPQLQALAAVTTALTGDSQPLRPERRGAERAPSAPIELRTAQIEPVAREAVTNELDVPEPAANVKLGAPTFPKTPEETARRAEVAFTARIVERAPARVEAGQAPSTERPTLDAPMARRGSPVESIRAPETTLASGSPGPPPPDTETPALEQQTAEAVSKNRQPTPQAKPAVSPHAPDQQPEKHEAAPEKWMKLDSLAQTTPRTEGLRTESQSVAPRQTTPAAAAREMAAEEPAFAVTRVPVRELRLQVPEAGREAGVEIRIRDQANEVNVSVRTRSPELAQSLRQALPDLVDRLGQRGLEAQVWRPAGSDIRVPAGERSLEVLEAESAGNSPNQDGAGRGQTGSEGQRQPHSDDSQPGWTEEWARNFEASPDARDRSEWQ